MPEGEQLILLIQAGWEIFVSTRLQFTCC